MIMFTEHGILKIVQHNHPSFIKILATSHDAIAKIWTDGSIPEPVTSTHKRPWTNMRVVSRDVWFRMLMNLEPTERWSTGDAFDVLAQIQQEVES